MGLIRLGLQIPSFTYSGVDDRDLFERTAQIAVTAEESGFDSVWVMDHLYQIPTVGPRTDPMLEAYTLLGAIAARTGRASLGTMVSGVTYRNPAFLAKVVTTLDVISSGRAILGIGAAWNDDEHAGYGFEFPPVPERMDRLEEALEICRAMFTEPEPSFAGRYYSIDRVLNQPRPVRPGGHPHPGRRGRRAPHPAAGGPLRRRLQRDGRPGHHPPQARGPSRTLRRGRSGPGRDHHDPAGALVIADTRPRPSGGVGGWPRPEAWTTTATGGTWWLATPTGCASSWLRSSRPVWTPGRQHARRRGPRPGPTGWSRHSPGPSAERPAQRRRAALAVRSGHTRRLP